LADLAEKPERRLGQTTQTALRKREHQLMKVTRAVVVFPRILRNPRNPRFQKAFRGLPERGLRSFHCNF
jgi:hypothetical protein